MVYESFGWIKLAQVSVLWRTISKTVMNCVLRSIFVLAGTEQEELTLAGNLQVL